MTVSDRPKAPKARRRAPVAAPTAPAPATRETTRSREAILAAALRTFACGGYDGASMPRIARLANVAPPLIHYYFGSKENLWRETVEHSLGALDRDARAVLGATRALAPLDRLRALLQAITHFAARCPDHFVMIVAEARSQSGRFEWLQQQYAGPLFAELVAILAAAHTAGDIADGDPEQLAFILIGGILLYFSMQPAAFAGRDVDQLASEFSDLMFRMFLDGVGRRATAAATPAAPG